MRCLLLSLALLTSAATSGCISDQSYTPIGEDREDELCKQTQNVDLSTTQSLALELDASGGASYSGSLEVTQFSRTSMKVDTEDLIVSVPAGSIASIEVDQGTYEFFTSMVFAIDVRATGSEAWQRFSVPTTELDFYWFTRVELNGAKGVGSLSTISPCSTTAATNDDAALPPGVFDGDHELRIRAFPFDGVGDLVGVYDYDVTVTVE